MKTVSLSGSPRESVGKKDAAQLRGQGQVPCILYGGETQTSFSVSELAIEKIVFTADVYIIQLDIDGAKKDAIIREIQFHPVTDRVLHVDFFELLPGKSIKMELPVKLLNNAIGVRNGGKPSFPNRTLKVEGVPFDFPDSIDVDIEKVKIGMKIRVSDLDLPGLKILASDDMVLFAVKTARGAVDEEEEEAEEGAEGEGAAAEAPAEG